MDYRQLTTEWTENPDLEGTLVHVERVAARPAIHADLDPPPPPALARRMAERGIERPYRHQVRGIDSIRAGHHTVLVSGTASGKSLTYQIPIVERILAEPRTTALLLYPTKALAQDQLRSFRRFELPGVDAATYDGDTPGQERVRIRKHANVVLTNPDMLHVGILPDHGRWADFLHRLSVVVVDEMHTLRGIFGTHVALVLRRLRRLAAHYGAQPTFVFSTATIGNPGDLAAALCGLPVEVIEGDDSPSGEKLVALWNPPLSDTNTGRRRSPVAETTDLLLDLVRRQVHTIVFTRSRKSTELIYRWAKQRVSPDLVDRIAPYRGGYLPTERRLIEKRLFNGELLGVIATNALELGIDVGALDAALLATFPGTLSAFRQQIGRAGRSSQHSLAVLVGGEDALDQYFMAHPEELFARPSEAGVINPSNPTVVDAHTGCAAYELPLTLEDREILGLESEESATRLVAAEHLALRNGRLYWARRYRPAPRIDIRTSGGGTYTLTGEGRMLGTVDGWRANRDAHAGAVYLHQGESFVVDRTDHRRREIELHRADVDYYTQAKEEMSLEILDQKATRRLGPAGHYLGGLRVETQVIGYQKRRIGSREVLDTVYLDLPPTRFDTEGIWFTIPEVLTAVVPSFDLLGALHAAEHAGIAMLPLLAICDRWDIGGLSTDWHPQTGMASIFIYEGFAGGAGISPIVYEAGVRHLRATLEAIRRCPCESGCPSCVQSPKCGNLNEPLSKSGAEALLQALLATEVNP